MLTVRCWHLTSKANGKYLLSRIPFRCGHTQSYAKTHTTNKFNFGFAVKLFDKRYYNVERVVKIQTDVNHFREPIFVFPGFEGRLTCMLPLIRNIGRTAYCLQYPFEGSPASIGETAAILFPHLETCVDPAQRVNIVAHSFGGLIAFEVVKLLESKGRRVRLCLTDSSPYALKVFGLNAFGDVLSDEFETNIIVVLLNSLSVNNVDQFRNVIESPSTFREKVDILSPVLTQFCPLESADIKIFFHGLFNLTKSMLVYDEDFAKFKCAAALIRPSLRIWGFPDAYKLSKFFENPVPEFFTDGHHVSMLKSKTTAATINKIFAE